MTDKRIQLWNLLHDGDITAISEEHGETLTMFVNIPFLRRRLKPLGDSLVVTLSGLTRFEFQNFDGTATRLSEEIEIGSPEILLSESESMPVEIETTMGRVILDFKSMSFTLDTGQAIDYETIEKIHEEYWTEWKTKAEQGVGADR